jgi:hypothetical protein
MPCSRGACGKRRRERSATIGIDEFNRVDLRIARIVAAEHVDGADKLLRLTLDVGEASRAPSSPASSRPIRPRISSAASRPWWPTSRRAR